MSAKHKEHVDIRASALHYLSPSVCYKYFNEQVHLVNGTKLETTEECVLFANQAPFKAHFPLFFREILSSSDLPHAFGIIVVALHRLDAVF